MSAQGNALGYQTPHTRPPRRGPTRQPRATPWVTKRPIRARPEGAQHVSPGQRPGLGNATTQSRPERAQHVSPGQRPGLGNATTQSRPERASQEDVTDSASGHIGASIIRRTLFCPFRAMVLGRFATQGGAALCPGLTCRCPYGARPLRVS
jgi:hypothetical protein